MDTTALFHLSYGMYVVSSKDGARDVGCIANSVIQVTSSPATLAISLNKDNYTTSCIQKANRLAVSVLSEQVPESVIGTFGFHTGKDEDKFDGIEHTVLESGVAVLNEGVCAHLEGRVVNQMDCGSHILFLVELTNARNASSEAPMTYSYYHKVIKGKSPKNAPTYVADAKEGEKAYVCGICGYEFEGSAEEFQSLPDSYVCPICGVPKSQFHST